ncbi:rsbT co-antagonist protein RsbR [Chryseomicrobium aureum]|uniref:STAS domain-containing protein n=1 Tax=Chryseomicrobium aureum TaxID=1441723 RepID=UPI00195740F9|nr:STAS domain-containing protein [Chryseomicrobium aureum]MBM7707784.1 rsbT co-antagonist protein RsbR [Chryseomicrobium aureum]
MTTEQEILELKEQLEYYKSIVYNMSSPIIPSIVSKTILVPVAGYIYRERFNNIETEVLTYIAEHREVENVVFDYTGVSTDDVSSFDFNELALAISNLNSSLKLMGMRPIYVGFNPKLIQEIVRAGVHVEIETYQSFRSALQGLLNEEKGKL